jgi:alkylated DNA repair dioxygenase AlkB
MEEGIAKVTKITDGVVVIENFLNIDQQQRLVKIVTEYGHLFKDDGKPNFSESRGRNYSNLDVYGEDDKQYMKKICEDTMKLVREADPSIPESDVTHLLTIYYVAQRGMGWHKDDGANDGDHDSPVISFTIGNSCIFDYKIDDIKHSVQLNSGDVIIFGGPQRFMYHQVKKCLKGTSPKDLKIDDVRINLTFRQAKSVIGKEDNFSTEKYLSRLKEKYDQKNKDK